MKQSLRLLHNVVICLIYLGPAQNLLNEGATVLAHQYVATLLEYVKQVCIEPLIERIFIVRFGLVLIQSNLPHSRTMWLELAFVDVATAGNAPTSADILAVATSSIVLMARTLFIWILLAVKISIAGSIGFSLLHRNP